MALTRQNLTPLDGFDSRIDWNAALERWNSRIIKAISGGDVLAAHCAAYGVTFLGFFVWNLIVDPTDLAGLRGFQYWGVLVAAHALLIGGYAVMSRLLGWNQPDFVTDAPPVHRVQRQSPDYRQTVPASVWSKGVESAARVNVTARRWVTPSRQSSSEEALWPTQPALLQADGHDDVGEVTWPETAPISTTLNASGNPSDQLVSIDHGSQNDAGTQTWLDGFVESRTKDKEQRWSWVEAAAGSWISKRTTASPAAQPEDVVITDRQNDSPDDETRAS